MRILSLFLILCFTTPYLLADERLFHKIERKIERNPEKGLAFAKKLKSKRVTEPDPYYFLAQDNHQRFSKTTLLRKKYTYLNRSASDAYKVRKYMKGNDYISKHAETLFSNVAKELIAYRDTFLRLQDDDKADRMAFRYHRLTGDHLPSRSEIAAQKRKEEVKKKLALEIPRHTDGLYYGMPVGDENIHSWNRDAEKEVVRILNEARIAKGLEPLKWSPHLAMAARYHANDMATQNYFSHSTYDRIDGELVQIGAPFKRIRKFYTQGFANGENIAAGSKLAKDTYYQWYTSKGHHDIMFKESSRYVAVGVAYNPNSAFKYYWVMCTARKR